MLCYKSVDGSSQAFTSRDLAVWQLASVVDNISQLYLGGLTTGLPFST